MVKADYADLLVCYLRPSIGQSGVDNSTLGETLMRTVLSECGDKSVFKYTASC
jgi:hypothetical protein